jgi:flagellar motility protein MotE (MotC chaperone)
MQERLLASTEKRINDKIVELGALEGKIKQHLGVFDTREQEQLRSIVTVYEKMKAKDAAPRFEMLDLTIQVDLVSMMKPVKVADLMSKMSPQAAQKLTTELATVAKPPSLEDVQGSN